MPCEAVEGLLSTADGLLTEGLVTNLFVVRDDGSGSTLLQTAPTSHALNGVVRQRLLEVCCCATSRAQLHSGMCRCASSKAS